ncbi:outer membrane beta-barrel protein [Altererythrobacter arenosus]|uniref:Outer membrane beta-barrel protein n=1 Tax=Altererythrobacter arenosus TaxID=3032592 RepID=A0ABY8FRD4_9SPHN|nr:outer membrane beta-barrel protein [Altererythrobacter sp. CAU 1644]WFL75961.1 outer membrane beta-barrel protein [Altererythrobacter sp. CAU 1644]
MLIAFFREIQDVAFVVRLLIAPRRKSRESVYRAIVVRSAAKKQTHRILALRLAAFCCVCMVAPRVAHAEAPDVITPIEMFDPDAGDGIRVSPGFILYPRATADVTYDTNIYNFENAEVEDAVMSFRPSFALRSDFARHAVSLEGGAEIRRYFDISDENSEQYRLNALALLELGYGIDVEATAGIARAIERRGTAGDLFLTDEPVAFDVKRAGLEIKRTGNRLELAVAARILDREYSDTLVGGVPVDLSRRDVTVRRASGRADFGLNARTRLFAEISGNEIDYDIATIPPRDSSGYAGLVGVKHELTALIDIEAGVGFIHQDFDNPAVSSAKGFNYRLAASWTPKPEWRITASASKVVDPSRRLDSPAIITNEFRLGAERALGDRLLVSAEVGYVEEDFRASPRKDKRFVAGASAIYRLADKIGLTFGAGYRDQDGGAFGRSYDGFSASVGVRVAW